MDKDVSGAIIKFVDAEITDTRLMGALGMRVHWSLSDGVSAPADIHQFLRYDVDTDSTELVGLVNGGDLSAIKNLSRKYFAPLGGKMVELTRRQCLALGRHFTKKSALPGEVLANHKMLSNFFEDGASGLSSSERAILMKKICAPIRGHYGLINYFLMRAFAKDEEAMNYLAEPVAVEEARAELYLSRPMDVRKNTIELFEDGDEATYLCEAVVQAAEEDYLALVEIRIRDDKVCFVKKNSLTRLSWYEKLTVLNVEDYLEMFEIISGKASLRRVLRDTVGPSMQFRHPSGELFMKINSNNEHVEKKIFRVDGDVSAIYFLTNAEQLIVVGKSADAVEQGLAPVNPLINRKLLESLGRYRMTTPVFYEFIDSGYDDFKEFLEDFDG